MADIRVTCKQCRAAYLVEESHRGKTTRCEECGSAVVIEADASALSLLPLVGDGLYLLPDIGLELRYIEVGEFIRGNQGLHPECCPAHTVVLSHPFMVGVTPVTQALYESITFRNPSGFTGPRLPVENVSWYEALEFCRGLTERSRMAGIIPPLCQFRLPTEAEWEWACCDPEQLGVEMLPDDRLTDLAWYAGNSAGRTHPVAQKTVSRRGLADCLGNVGEWCLDWYAPYSAGTLTDPFGPATGSRKVRRGGSWGCCTSRCQASDRVGVAPGLRSSRVGFRVVLSEAVT